MVVVYQREGELKHPCLPFSSFLLSISFIYFIPTSITLVMTRHHLFSSSQFRQTPTAVQQRIISDIDLMFFSPSPHFRIQKNYFTMMLQAKTDAVLLSTFFYNSCAWRIFHTSAYVHIFIFRQVTEKNICSVPECLAIQCSDRLEKMFF